MVIDIDIYLFWRQKIEKEYPDAEKVIVHIDDDNPYESTDIEIFPRQISPQVS